MGCSHARHCPLFPYLNASLGSWREAYCDSVSGWNSCARYRLARSGEPVPIALLPNGQLPMSMIPNLPRREAARLSTTLGSCGSPDGHDGVATEPGRAAVNGSASSDAESAPLPPLLLDYPVPPLRRAQPPLAVRVVADLVRRAVHHERWTRVVAWLRAPA